MYNISMSRSWLAPASRAAFSRSPPCVLLQPRGPAEVMAGAEVKQCVALFCIVSGVADLDVLCCAVLLQVLASRVTA